MRTSKYTSLLIVGFSLLFLSACGSEDPSNNSSANNEGEPVECQPEQPNADEWCHERYVDNPEPDLDPNWLHPENLYCAEDIKRCVECRTDEECEEGELCDKVSCYKFSE